MALDGGWELYDELPFTSAARHRSRRQPLDGRVALALRADGDARTGGRTQIEPGARFMHSLVVWMKRRLALFRSLPPDVID